MSLSECKDVINNIWQISFPEAIPPVVKDGRGSLNARANRDYIALPRWSRTMPGLLHETSHSFVEEIFGHDYLSQMDGHGAEFARVYIQLLSQYTELDKLYLLQSAKENNVQITMEDILGEESFIGHIAA